MKAFLDVHGIPYKTVEVDPFSKKELQPHAYKKVPQIRIGGPEGPLIVDSTEIVNILAPVVGAKLTADVNAWRTWGSEILVRYLVLKMNGSVTDSVSNYKYIQAQDMSWGLKMKYMTAGAVMFVVAHKVVKKNLRKTGCKAEDIPRELDQELAKWVEDAVGDKAFHGGEAPSVADTDIFGLIRCLKGHKLYTELREASVAGPWMQRMENQMAARRGGPP